MPTKIEARQRALAQRKVFARELTPALRTTLEADLVQIVLPHLIEARIVAGYHPMIDEISPYPVSRSARRRAARRPALVRRPATNG